METKTMYQCGRCGELYHNEKYADSCEKCHYIIKSVKAIYEKGKPMPKAIDIEFINKNNCNINKRFYLG